jgi:hypothetical protein
MKMKILASSGFSYFLGMNFLVLCLWFWTKDGSQSHLLIDVTDTKISFTCGNSEPFVVLKSGDREGNIGLELLPESRPVIEFVPQSLDNLVVTSLSTNNVILQDDFSSVITQWNLLNGEFFINKKGQLAGLKRAFVVSRIPVSPPYRMEVDIYNMTKINLYLGYRSPSDFIRINLTPWRESAMCIESFRGGVSEFASLRSFSEPALGSLKIIIGRLIKSYGHGLAILGSVMVFYVFICIILTPFGFFMKKMSSIVHRTGP